MQKRPGTESGTPKPARRKVATQTRSLTDSSASWRKAWPILLPLLRGCPPLSTPHSKGTNPTQGRHTPAPWARACSPGGRSTQVVVFAAGSPPPHLSGCYTRHRHGSIRRVGLRARPVQGNTGPPRRGRCPEKEQKASPAQMWVPTRRLENRRQGTDSSLSDSSSGSASGTGCPPRIPDL